jgi:hypothetical protein
MPDSFFTVNNFLYNKRLDLNLDACFFDIFNF